MSILSGILSDLFRKKCKFEENITLSGGDSSGTEGNSAKGK